MKRLVILSVIVALLGCGADDDFTGWGSSAKGDTAVMGSSEVPFAFSMPYKKSKDHWESLDCYAHALPDYVNPRDATFHFSRDWKADQQPNSLCLVHKATKYTYEDIQIGETRNILEGEYDAYLNGTEFAFILGKEETEISRRSPLPFLLPSDLQDTGKPTFYLGYFEVEDPRIQRFVVKPQISDRRGEKLAVDYVSKGGSDGSFDTFNGKCGLAVLPGTYTFEGYADESLDELIAHKTTKFDPASSGSVSQ